MMLMTLTDETREFCEPQPSQVPRPTQRRLHYVVSQET